MTINSLAPGKFAWNFRHVIFKQIVVIDGWGISYEIALLWMSLDFTDDQSTLVQVMAWCRQATTHYLSQCWPSSMSPYGVTRPQWLLIGVRVYRYNTDTQNMMVKVMYNRHHSYMSMQINYPNPRTHVTHIGGWIVRPLVGANNIAPKWQEGFACLTT